MARSAKAKTVKVVSLENVKTDGKYHPPGGGPWDCPADQYGRLKELGAVASYSPEPEPEPEEDDGGSGEKETGGKDTNE